MSIRIHKQIGYYLSKKLFSQFLKPNFKEIMENFDYQDDFDEIFKEKLNTLVKEYRTSEHFNNTHQRMMSYYLSDSQYKWSAIELISKIFNYDTFKGILFSTPDLLKNNHFDDTIDYYEANSMNFKIQNLLQPIYPISGFIYTGGLENTNAGDFLNDFFKDENKSLRKGTIVDNQLINTVIHITDGKINNNKQKYLKQIQNTKSFHPEVDPLAFLIAKASGILNANLSEYDFRTNVHPSIITSWG